MVVSEYRYVLESFALWLFSCPSWYLSAMLVSESLEFRWSPASYTPRPPTLDVPLIFADQVDGAYLREEVFIILYSI